MASTYLNHPRSKPMKKLTKGDLKKLAMIGREVHYTRGCYVFKENEKGDSVFILLRGAVEVQKKIRGKGEVSLRSLKAGDLFGEMSLFTGRRRSASCQVIRPAVVLEISNTQFKKFLRDGDAVALKLVEINCQLLAERLDHVLGLIGSDSFSTSIENPIFMRKLKFFWTV